MGKPGCHLCDEMRTAIQPVLAEFGAVLVERDVRDDPEWERRYLFEIPVLLFGDRELLRHRASPEELRQRLRELGLRPAR